VQLQIKDLLISSIQDGAWTLP